MGATSSLSFTLKDPVPSFDGKTQWQLFDGVHKTDAAAVSIFKMTVRTECGMTSPHSVT